jgi:glycosyltransferase involved in cell wall biosynthesis
VTRNGACPLLSIIVVVYDMAREAPRTVHSLSAAYQRGVHESDYEVVIVDNGSPARLAPDVLRSFAANVRYLYLDGAPPSPAFAVNYGVRQSRGAVVGIMIDGARLLSPGVVRHALGAAKAFGDSLIATLGWHLGPDVQMRSVANGYSCEREDRLLADIDWPKDGYRLFEIAALAGSSDRGWFLPMAESNCLFLRRETFDELGGYDERFDAPGGGLVNLDFYKRACERSSLDSVVILGEGSFHQVHGGVATNVAEDENQRLWHEWEAQYAAIRGVRYSRPTRRALLIGHVPPPALKWLRYSAEALQRRWE